MSSRRENYVTVQEAAERLGVSRQKVWRLIADGTLPAHADVLDRRQKLIATADLDRLAAGRVEPLPASNRSREEGSK